MLGECVSVCERERERENKKKEVKAAMKGDAAFHRFFASQVVSPRWPPLSLLALFSPPPVSCFRLFSVFPPPLLSFASSSSFSSLPCFFVLFTSFSPHYVASNSPPHCVFSSSSAFSSSRFLRILLAVEFSPPPVFSATQFIRCAASSSSVLVFSAATVTRISASRFLHFLRLVVFFFSSSSFLHFLVAVLSSLCLRFLLLFLRLCFLRPRPFVARARIL